jgi:hypothetical protein
MKNENFAFCNLQFTTEAIIIWTGFYLFMILDSGFRRNDNKEPCPSMLVTPAKAGVQLKGFKKKNPEQ